MAATWQDVSRKGHSCRPSQETWSGGSGYVECVKKCAFKKLSQEPAGTSSCTAQGGVLICQRTPEDLSDSISDQVWWWWTQQLQSHPSSFLHSLERSGCPDCWIPLCWEWVTCPIFCLASDDFLPLQPIRLSIISTSPSTSPCPFASWHPSWSSPSASPQPHSLRTLLNANTSNISVLTRKCLWALVSPSGTKQPQSQESSC